MWSCHSIFLHVVGWFFRPLPEEPMRVYNTEIRPEKEPSPGLVSLEARS